MLIDSKESFVPLGSPLSLIAGAGVAIPSPGIIDLLGNGAGTTVQNITGIATVPGQADGMGVGNVRSELVVAIGTALATGTSATLTVQYQGAPDDGTGNPGTYVTYGESGAITAAQGTAGRIIARLPWLPPFLQNARPRFIRLNFATPSGALLTAGTIAYALVTQARDDAYNLQQPRNYSVAGVA